MFVFGTTGKRSGGCRTDNPIQHKQWSVNVCHGPHRFLSLAEVESFPLTDSVTIPHLRCAQHCSPIAHTTATSGLNVHEPQGRPNHASRSITPGESPILLNQCDVEMKNAEVRELQTSACEADMRESLFVDSSHTRVLICGFCTHNVAHVTATPCQLINKILHQHPVILNS